MVKSTNTRIVVKKFTFVCMVDNEGCVVFEIVTIKLDDMLGNVTR